MVIESLHLHKKALDAKQVILQPSSSPPSLMTEKSDIASSRHIEDARHPPNADSIAMHNAAIEKAISKKCDIHIVLPTMLMWLMTYIDRTNMGNALALGAAQDIGLEGNQINLALSAFAVAYIFFGIPSNLLCNRIGPRLWIPGIVCGFGIATMCTAFVTSFGGLVTIRVLLGMLEAGMESGILTTYGRFYRRHQIMTRQGFKASMAALSGSFGGLLASGLSHIPPAGPLSSWRWIFLIEGLLTICTAVFGWLLLADGPTTASFLNDIERPIAVSRINSEIKTKQRGQVSLQTFKKAVLSIHVQALALALLCSLMNMTSIALFTPTLLYDSMGYGQTQAQLLSVPPYALAALVLLAAAIVSDRLKLRGPILGLVAPCTFIGFALMRFSSDIAVRYAGIFFAATGAFSASSMLSAWCVDNTSGPTVRAISVAYVAAAGNIGSLVATWTYREVEAPGYAEGNNVNMAFGALLTAIVPVLTLYLAWENRQRTAGKRDGRIANKTEEEISELGHHNPDFRFTL